MRRRDFIIFTGGWAVVWPMTLRAQQASKFYRLAYLALAGDLDAVIVKQRLNELGYGEGKNLIFDFRSAEGEYTRLPRLAAALVETNPDVIVPVSVPRPLRQRKPRRGAYRSYSPVWVIQSVLASSRT